MDVQDRSVQDLRQADLLTKTSKIAWHAETNVSTVQPPSPNHWLEDFDMAEATSSEDGRNYMIGTCGCFWSLGWTRPKVDRN